MGSTSLGMCPDAPGRPASVTSNFESTANCPVDMKSYTNDEIDTGAGRDNSFAKADKI